MGLSRTTPKAKGSKSLFRIAVKRLEIGENVNRARLITHFLAALKCCHEQWYSFRWSPKWVNADWAQFVRQSSSLISIVVTTLLIVYWYRRCPSPPTPSQVTLFAAFREYRDQKCLITYARGKEVPELPFWNCPSFRNRLRHCRETSQHDPKSTHLTWFAAQRK